MEQKEISDKLKLIEKTLNAALEIKADESMHDTQTGYGEEFVPSDLSSSIIAKLRDKETVLSNLPAPITMPTPVYKIPVEGGDPTFFYTGENTDVPWTAVTTSKAGTGDIVLTAKKFSASTYVSGELDDDSIINIRPYVENKLAKAYAELLDKVIINWDTTTAATGNVNSDDGAPTAGTYYLAMDGLRKSAIDNSNTVNAGTLDITDFRAARVAMGDRGLEPSDLLWVVSSGVYFKILWLTQVETIEKFGTAATIVNGVLKAIDGIKVVVNKDVPNTEADGKVSVTPGNNTLGTSVLVYKPDIISGFKRQLKISVSYLDEFDQFRITAHTRFAMTIVDTNAVASLINATIV